MSGTYSCTVSVNGNVSLAGTTVVTVSPPSVGGTATPTAATVCSGGSTTITLTGYTGAIQWYYSTDGWATWAALGTAPSFSTGPLTTKTWYVANVTSGPCALSQSLQAVVDVNTQVSNPTSATAGVSTICNGGSTTVTLNGGGAGTGGSVKWYTSSCGSGLVGTGNPLTVSPTSTTTYWGRYEDPAPCSDVSTCASVTVTVNAMPATPGAGNNGPVCAGSPLTLNTPTVSGASYAWTGPLGFTSSAQNPTVSASATAGMAGTYNVTVTVAGCTSAAGTTAVTVYANSPAPTVGNNGPVCAGSTLSLTASPVSGATYAWTGPNGFTSAAQNPTIPNATIAATGIYSVTATVGGCTSAAGTTAATVKALPAAPTAGNGGDVCPGSTLSLTASTVSGATYAWTGPNGFTSADQNPTIPNATTAATGIYSVTATVNGCTSAAGTTTATVSDTTPPTVISYPADVTITL